MRHKEGRKQIAFGICRGGHVPQDGPGRAVVISDAGLRYFGIFGDMYLCKNQILVWGSRIGCSFFDRSGAAVYFVSTGKEADYAGKWMFPGTAEADGGFPSAGAEWRV